jgi:hypothetical protein
VEVAQTRCWLGRLGRSRQGRKRWSASSPDYRHKSVRAAFFRRPPFFNSCFGHGFCSGFGFGFEASLFCDPTFGFGTCFPFFGSVFGFQADSFSAGADPQDMPSSADLSSTPESPYEDGAEPNHPITLLQLKNGWMYGLTDYWVEGDNLHYVTNYGGKNSVPLEVIDLATTIRLNSERGVEFSLHRKRQSPAQ